jgi:hypothetical protein
MAGSLREITVKNEFSPQAKDFSRESQTADQTLTKYTHNAKPFDLKFQPKRGAYDPIFEELGSVNEQNLFGGKIHAGSPASVTGNKSEQLARLPTPRNNAFFLCGAIVRSRPYSAIRASDEPTAGICFCAHVCRDRTPAAPRPKRPVDIRSDNDSSGSVTDIGRDMFPTAAF